MLERSPVTTCIPLLQSRPESAHTGLVIMLEVAVGVEVETDEDLMTSASDIIRLRRRFGVSGVD